MWNDSEPFLISSPEADLQSQELSSTSPSPPIYELDEASYSIFFSTYNPTSPVYSQNNTDLGISIGMLKFWVEGFGITTLSILGVIGNILSICVLSSPRMKNSSSVFLMCLALCDIVALVGATLLIGIPSLLAYHPDEDGEKGEPLYVFNENIVKYGNVMPSASLFAISVTALTGSIFFTMALTLERYLAVCHPFLARSLCTWSRAVVLSAIVFFVSIFYNLPRWWEFTYVEEPTIKNLTMFRPVPTLMKANAAYDTYYVHLSYVLSQFFLPVGFLIIFNILIYKEIKLANKMRKNLSPTQKNENSLTRMLFGVVAVFLLCNLSPAIHTIYRTAQGTREFVPEAEFLWCFMVILNSSVNFLIYCASGGKFRQVFCDMFCCWRTSVRIRQFATSTKTTFRSLSVSTYSRSRAYSVQSTRRDDYPQNLNPPHHLTNNNAIFPDGKFSMPPYPSTTALVITPTLTPPAATCEATVENIAYENNDDEGFDDEDNTYPAAVNERNRDISFII